MFLVGIWSNPLIAVQCLAEYNTLESFYTCLFHNIESLTESISKTYTIFGLVSILSIGD